MKIRFKSSCVFHGDRAAGEIVEFAALPPDAAIVIGAGMAEILEDEPEEPRGMHEEPQEMPREALEGHDSDDEPSEHSTPAKTPAKHSAKRKR